MAQMLRDEDSTDKHLDVTRRHIRRCRKTKGAGGLGERITPFRQTLKDCQTETTARSDATEDAADDVELAGLEAADTVRTVASRAEEHDREHPGEGALIHLIPSGRFGDLVRSDGSVSPEDLEAIAGRAEKLAEDHPLRPFAATLREKAAASRAAASASEESLKQLRQAELQEELAQAALRREFENNYLDARKTFRAFAERLFPKIRRARARVAEPTPTAPTDVTNTPE